LDVGLAEEFVLGKDIVEEVGSDSFGGAEL